MNLLLNNGANPNVRGGDDNKPVIVIAAEELYKDDIELLLDKDADINATCDHGSTALMKCAWMMDDDGMQLLISRKADITVSSKKWGTALHSAASQGYIEGCRLLLEAGADIAAVGGELGTPLTAAAKSGDIDTLRLLLEADQKNVTLDLIAGEFGTPLQAACAAGNTEIAEELIEHGASINLQPPNGTYGFPLHAAAQAGDTEILDLLLKNHADVELEGGIHGFALIAAAAAATYQLGALEGVETLLSHGAAVSPVSQRGLFGSAVAAAAFANHDEVLSLLIEKGADIHQTGGKYGSPLICAVIGTAKSSGETNDEDTVDTTCFDTLLSHGADVNHRSSGKYHTALIAAAYFDRHELVSKLLERGADLGARYDGKYTSAVAAAAIKGNSKTLEMLLEKNPPAQLLDEALVESCAHRQFSSVKTLVQKGASLHKRHPVFGTAMDALNSPQADAYNSDDELMSDGDDSDDSDEEEDSDDEASDDDEEDGSDEDDDSDAESETSVPDEAGESEELKIRKLLEENLKPLRRKTTVKRGHTVKRHGLPGNLQSAPRQEQPFEASYQQHQVSVGIEFNGMPYVQQQQQQLQAPHQPAIQHYAPVSQQASENIHAGKLPPSLPYTANPTSSGPYPTQPEPLRRKPVPSRYTPSPTGQKPETVSSQQNVSGTPSGRPSLAPQSHTSSQDYVYQSMNPAAGGTPPTNQGPVEPFQRQSSYGSPSVYNSQQAYSPYNPPPATGQYAAPATQSQYNPVPPQQQYMTTSYHQPPPPNTYPQPYQQHTGQAQNQYSPSPPQPQYQPFTPPQPSQQQTGYTPYGQQSRLSSTASYQTSQSDNSAYWGSQHTMYSTPNSSQASGLGAQYPKPGARRE